MEKWLTVLLAATMLLGSAFGVAEAAIYVAESGSNTTGDGTEGNPYRTITKGLASRGAETVINVGMGTYNAGAGEVFPLAPPAGVSIVGTMGTVQDASDSTVLDGGGTAKALILPQTPANCASQIRNLVISGALGTAIEATDWTGTIDGCVITNVADTTPVALACALRASRSTITLKNTTIENITSSSWECVGFSECGNVTVDGCTFSNILCTSNILWLDARYSSSTVTDCVFDNTNASNAANSLVESFSQSVFLVERCIFRNITTGPVLFQYSQYYDVNNCLFYNIQNGTKGLVAAMYGGASFHNCTIDRCSSVTGSLRETGGAGFVNCSISNCGVLSTMPRNDYGQSLPGIGHSNLFATPLGYGYEDGHYPNSSVTTYDPGYVNAFAGDYHIPRVSPLVDAGEEGFMSSSYDLDGNTRLFDADNDGEATVDMGCYEYQPIARIIGFTVKDATSGSSLVTNASTVNIAIAVDVPADVSGWLVTESPATPYIGWLGSAPTTYQIQAASGANVTLYAWIKYSGNTASKAATICYNTAAPVASNIAITAGPPGSGAAILTWYTDIPAEGSVSYREACRVGATPSLAAETALTTSHALLLTGIASGKNYEFTLVNNEVACPVFYWPSWPIRGDADMDGNVNILDLIFVRNKLNQDPYTGNNWKADVNGDGRINVLDMIYVRNRLNTKCP